MKTGCFLALFLSLFLSPIVKGQSCNNWLHLPSHPSYVRVGDLDIPGNKLTIEARFVRTAPWTGSDLFQGDLVSKHGSSTDCNYLLRPGCAEITTTNGYFKTPAICQIELNKVYHVAMVYDGTSLKFYRNGFLMSQVPASGNLVQNNWQTQIGLYFNQVTQENLLGYINEVRIWNLARTQDQIRTYMNQSLPLPQTTPGLMAYYSFDNLLNKQGNTSWNGSLGGSAAISQTNPHCNFVADSCGVLQVNVNASFTVSDTVCVNEPVTISNNSAGASSYLWNFCTANTNSIPTGSNMENPGAQLTTPCFMDYASENGNFYGFIVNNNPASLVRLDFGNSLLNNPTAVNLGNFGGIIPLGAQGIQLVQEGGNWYAIITGGDSTAAPSATSRIIKVDFGASLTNTSPIVTNWGNVGGLSYPVDLFMFKDAGVWHGFTVNYHNNTITSFNFGPNFNSPPTGVNLGNLGGLNQPSGLCPANDNGVWRLFVANFGNHTISRIDFGSGMLSPPTGAVNLGSLGGVMNRPRDMYIFNYCNESVGFLVNDNTHELVRLNFNSLTSIPVATSLGNVAGFSNPHSISKLFRVGSDLFAFVPNSYVNTISRIRFSGCNNANNPNSNLQNPAPVTYDAPGTYNITLTVDEGLITQSSVCKKVVVLSPPAISPLSTVDICSGNAITINPTVVGATSYSWNPATGLSDPDIVNPVASPAVTSQYTLTATKSGGCSTTATLTVNVLTPQQCGQANVVPSFNIPDTVCVGTPVTINNTTSGASNYYWNFCVADVNTTPTGSNLGNPGTNFNMPVFSDIAEDNGNFYGFVANHAGGGITRLNFGNSLLNTPTTTFFPNISGAFNTGLGTEGIQIVKANGKWYGLVVGGSPNSGPNSTPRLITIYFGTSLNNPNPTAVNWGNLGNMLQPIDLHVFQENGNWYGFTTNAENNTITRFNFTSSFENPPTAINLGNIGGLNYPTGVFAVNDNGFWRVFVTNGQTNPTLSRLDFGNSLLNTPTGVNLGNPGGILVAPRDITVMNYCGQSLAFVVNGSNSLIRLNFTSLGSTPTGTEIGNIGNFGFPHSLSKLFRVGNDLYTLVTNVSNNTITRIRFEGCSGSSIPNSNLQNPSPVVYNSPGLYNINLSVDEGLPTQAAICKQVVVVDKPPHTPTQNFTICPGGSIKIGAAVKPASYLWNTGATTDSIVVNGPGTYWVETNRYGCSVRDSFIVSLAAQPVLHIFNSDTTIFEGDYVQLNHTQISGTYSWTQASSLNCADCSHPIASPQLTTTYVLSVITSCGLLQDSVKITVVPRPAQSCSGFQLALGGLMKDQAFDVVPSINDEFIVVGLKTDGTNDDILIAKLDLDGNLIWSKTIGGIDDEIVRKVSRTADGGVLIAGQTKSFTNLNGDMLCMKVSNAGVLEWSRKFSAGSTFGDMAMELIETTDGGYALTGILNVAGAVANSTVIKLNAAGDPVWSKQFDHLDGDDGVGVVQRGDTLVVTADLQSAGGNYSFVVMKLSMGTGDVLAAKKITPVARGLFNPYIYKNPAAPGYIISGHTIDGISYANMKHTILFLNDQLEVTGTKLINITPVTNDHFTGFYPMPDGSFIGCASPTANADGFVYHIGANNNILYTKRFNSTSERRLYRLTVTGKEVIAVGGTVRNGQEDMFITSFGSNGTLDQNCEVQDFSVSVQQPAYTAADFTWPVVNNQSFTNFNVSWTISDINLASASLCSGQGLDFGYQQDICDPLTVQFTSSLNAPLSFEWNFGNNQTNTTSETPVVTYAAYGNYVIKLKVDYPNGCPDSLQKTISVENVFDAALVFNQDTTICLGDSLQLQTWQTLDYCWKVTHGNAPGSLNAIVKPSDTTTYILNSQITGVNLVTNGDFSAGNTGFSSDYVHAFPNTTEGQYWIGPAPGSWNGAMNNCTDHTTGNGNMMAVNGAPVANAKVWSQTVQVTPNTNYLFSAWVQSLHGLNPASLQFSINYVNLGNNINAGSTSCQWQQFSSQWNSGNHTTAVITIVNMNTIAAGNDFALDDIFFGTVTTRTDSFTVHVRGLCDSIQLTGPDKICSASDTLTYSVFRSAGCDQPYSLEVDNAFVDVVSLTPSSIRVVFKQNGVTGIRVVFANDCKTVADSLNVTIKFSPTSINLGPDLITCKDTVFTLDAGGGLENYIWQDGSNSSTFLVNSPGNYQVTAQNICGAVFSDQFQFTQNQVVPFAASPSHVEACAGDSVQFTASGGSIYSWQPASRFAQPANAGSKALIDATQNFTVLISDPVCQRDTLITIPVVAVDEADIEIVKSNDVSCENDSAVLIAIGGVSYTWSPNLYISRSGSDRITVKPPQSVTYLVTGVNALGCVGQDSVRVEFIREGEQKLFIPTAFTPNGDGLNDLFRPIFIGPAKNYELRIFNRWGQLVFKTNNPSIGWDGRLAANVQKSDVYVYLITAEGDCNGKFERRGSFVLIK